VFSARATERGYHLTTSTGTIRCRFLVAATGAMATPNIPAPAACLPDRIHQTSPKYYRRPGDLPDGGVLVVGASASGIQLARELQRSGRQVTLAIGEHTRIPRRYRGLDIHEWLDIMGTLERPFDTFADLASARREPSLQLVGDDEGRSIDLAELQRLGVRLRGRLASFSAGTAHFEGGLRDSVSAADDAQAALLDRIDRWAARHGLDVEVDAPDRPAPVVVRDEATTVDLAGIDTVLWATGYRPDFSWLSCPAVEADGTLHHVGGVAAHGLYFLGLPVMRTRKSTFIDGVGADAEAHAAHIALALAGASRGQDATVGA
jgi:putative flavoprotein involved in K+ transport